MVCCFDCAIKLEADKKEKKWKERKREFKKKDKTYTQKVNEAKKVFQKWVRLRDKDKPCISCGTTTSDIWDGGHFKKAELYSSTIFDEDNVWKQCRKCNRFLGGNELNYREGLIKRIGLERVEAVEERASERVYKYTDQELEEIKTKYKKLINEQTRNSR